MCTCVLLQEIDSVPTLNDGGGGEKGREGETEEGREEGGGRKGGGRKGRKEEGMGERKIGRGEEEGGRRVISQVRMSSAFVFVT